MEKLTAENLQFAIEQCAGIPHTKVVIAVEDYREAKDAINIMAELMGDLPSINRITKFNHRVDFKNGSEIKILPTCDHTRGRKAHIVLYSESVKNDVMYLSVLKAVEMPFLSSIRRGIPESNHLGNWIKDQIEQEIEDDTEDSEELNGFLGTFKINK